MSIKEKFSSAIAKLKWRTLYNVMHELESSDNMTFIPALWNMRLIGEIIDPVGGRIDKLVDKLMHTTFQVIYENHYELSVLAYDNLDEEQKFDLIKNITWGLHKKIATTPKMKNALRDVKLYQPRDSEKLAKKKKFMTGQYNIYNQDITYSARGLNRPVNAVISTIIHEYIHVLQTTYNSALPTPILNISYKRPLARILTPYKKRALEIEARRATKIVQTDFTPEFQRFLDIKRKEFYD